MARKGTGFYGIIGQSAAMEKVFDHIKRAARTDVSVLITGESGTGKELVARAIHDHSPRSKGPYLPCNTGAILPNLVPSTLFGHKKGAFTGAVETRKGYFEQADEGTLFLDEISNIDQEMQIALLRVLETKSVRRIGAVRSRRVNTRIIAASNRNLRKLVSVHKFREDLFYRLEVFSIGLPPLRERREDIPLLVQHFINKYNKEFSKSVNGISRDAMHRLERCLWPGNVRELENTVQRSLVLTDNGRKITEKQLPDRVFGRSERDDAIYFKLGMTLEEVQKRMIEATLRKCNGNKAAASRMLGITRRTLYNNLVRYGIEHEP
jgi:transcriptional regulator with PAS, ATPase and Fis domain